MKVKRKAMNVKELIDVLQTLDPSMPVGTSALYLSNADRNSHGTLEVGIARSYAGDHVVIGPMLEHTLKNGANWSLKQMIHDGRPAAE